MLQFLRILKMLRPYWQYMAYSLLVAIFVMLFSIPGPYLTKVLIDDVYPHKDFDLLVLILVITLAVSIGLGFTGFLRGHFRTCVGIYLGFDFQSRFYHHVQSLDFGFFDNKEIGDIISRFGDMRSSTSSIIAMFNALIINVLKLLIFPLILLYINWRLALISMVVLPFDVLLVSVTRKYIRRFAQKTAEASATLSAQTYESLSGIRTIQALGIEATFFSKFRTSFIDVSKLGIKSSLLGGGSSFIASTFRAIGAFAYGWYGWSEVLEGNLTLGSYLAFNGYVGYMYGPIRSLINLIPQMEVTLVHANRFFEIHDLSPQVKNDSALPEAGQLRGEVEFHNISFAYEGQEWVVRDISLHIPAYSTVALVGRSGAGKSTLAKLIPRFYDPQIGYVSIDGTDIRQFRLNSLRQNIGFALQGSVLFQGSILENLTFGREIPFGDVEKSTRMAFIHEFISSLPEGYHTQIGEQGAKLSEGQKQRIALARVLLQNSAILILDEPTAALDFESEFYIQEALKQVQQDRTTIIIAHRLSTIQNVDTIVVIDEGQIAEMGKHEELLMNQGVYASLYQRMASI